MMKLVFFGTPDFAIPSLYLLHKSEHEILSVVTAPDKRSGRGLKKRSSPVKQAALEFNYPIYQPSYLKDPYFLSVMKNLEADIFVVVAYRILPEELIIIPQEGAINIHASLLPKYRGPAPIHHAILNGEIETGVTIIRLQKKVDTGDILLQQHYKLNRNITTGEVNINLANIGAELIIMTLDHIENNKIIPVQQDHSSQTSASKISSDDYLIHWNNSAEQIHNQIRAFSPHPGAHTYFNLKRIMLFNSEIINSDQTLFLQPGEINYNNNCLVIGTGFGLIYIHEIQREGKKRMSVNQFISGLPQIKGDFFG